MKLWNVMMAAMTLAAGAVAAEPDSGSLSRVLPDGRMVECPLKHTDVKAQISGPIAGVTVRQDFVNEGRDTIEAVYNFPLPVMAAVDGYEIHVNDRIVKGKIARREDAERAYREAQRKGQTPAPPHPPPPKVLSPLLSQIPAGAKGERKHSPY